jgi:hypothetical protein
LPATGATPVDQRQQLGDVVAVAAGQPIASGMLPESVSRWCFEPVRARLSGEGPVKAPLKSTDMASVDDTGRPVDPTGRVQAAQQLAVHPLEDPGGLPLGQPAVRGRRRGPKLARQVLPRESQ